MKMTESQKVAAAAWRIRRYALQMGEVQGQGYIGQALGYADVLATAFSHAMTYRPEDPEWEGRDRFRLAGAGAVYRRRHGARAAAETE